MLSVTPGQSTQSPSPENSMPLDVSTRRFLFAAAAVTVLFALPLYELLRLAFRSDLHSHVLLIPFVSWFVWRFVDRNTPAGTNYSDRSLLPIVAAAFSGLAFAITFIFARYVQDGAIVDILWLAIFAYLSFLLVAALSTVGWVRLRPHLFAIAFLVFFVPLPPAFTDVFSRVLQHASAEVSNLTLRLTGMPVFRDGLVFQLPGLRIFVAEECSGIRSTLVLFIVSVISAQLFLRTRWKKAIFICAVLPIGVLRNALRITTISWLTVNVDSEIINSPLHHRGGPLFFAVSLVPLFLLLWLFRKSDLRSGSRSVSLKNP